MYLLQPLRNKASAFQLKAILFEFNQVEIKQVSEQIITMLLLTFKKSQRQNWLILYRSMTNFRRFIAIIPTICNMLKQHTTSERLSKNAFSVSRSPIGLYEVIVSTRRFLELFGGYASSRDTFASSSIVWNVYRLDVNWIY